MNRTLEEQFEAVETSHEVWINEEEKLHKEESTSDGRLLLDPGTIVRLHSLQSTEMNGRHGVVEGYVRSKDRFAIRLEGDTITRAIRASNMSAITANETPTTDAASRTGATLLKVMWDSPEYLRKSIFVPGMKFTGTIVIPGLEGVVTGKVPYS